MIKEKKTETERKLAKASAGKKIETNDVPRSSALAGSAACSLVEEKKTETLAQPCSILEGKKIETNVVPRPSSSTDSASNAKITGYFADFGDGNFCLTACDRVGFCVYKFKIFRKANRCDDSMELDCKFSKICNYEFDDMISPRKEA